MKQLCVQNNPSACTSGEALKFDLQIVNKKIQILKLQIYQNTITYYSREEGFRLYLSVDDLVRILLYSFLIDTYLRIFNKILVK